MADFSQITSRLFTGAAINSNEDVHDLIRAGVSHVIDCRQEFIDGALIAHHKEITYLHNGTNDDGKPKEVEWFKRSLEFALPALSVPHNKVYAHCQLGRNRGPSTAFAIMLALGFSVDDTEKLIRKARPIVLLDYKNDAIKAIHALGYA